MPDAISSHLNRIPAPSAAAISGSVVTTITEAGRCVAGAKITRSTVMAATRDARVAGHRAAKPA
jgi:hypothetical protein